MRERSAWVAVVMLSVLGMGPTPSVPMTASAEPASDVKVDGRMPAALAHAVVSDRAASAPDKSTGDRRAILAGVRIPFIPNEGQTDPAVAYYAPTFAGTVYITRDGQIVYSLTGTAQVRDDGHGTHRSEPPPVPDWTLTETPVDGIAGRPSAGDAHRARTSVSHFAGADPRRWAIGLPTYEAVSLGEVWPGVSVSVRAAGRNVEKLFTVAPGADPAQIRMRMAGATWLGTDDSGSLVAASPSRRVAFTAPVAYQEHGAMRRRVDVAYQVRGDEYRFRLGSYDATIPLVIDPLLQTTYLGGTSNDFGHAVAIHPVSGDVYVAGAASVNFPGTAGGAQPTPAGSDAFVARLTGDLGTLTQATYLGGSAADIAYAIAVHPASGDVYVAGKTFSTNLPGTAGAAQPNRGGSYDAFVARLTADLTSLTRATYLGGSASDETRALAIHPTSGEVYVAGYTASDDVPGTVGAAQPGSAGRNDGFVARLSADLATLGRTTYVGGTRDDYAYALAIHPVSGEAYVAGQTASGDLPGTTGGAQPAKNPLANPDGFVARFTAPLTSLVQATYLGAAGVDIASAVTIHPGSGDVYVAGQTQSAAFPGTVGGAQPTYAGDGDAFVARLTTTLTGLTQATYVGGGSRDEARAVAIHPTSGEVYVAGETLSADLPATTGGAQATLAGSADAFVARLPESLTALSRVTYLGGSSGGDEAQALAIHPTTGDVYVVGITASTDLIGTAGGAQEQRGGVSDAFAARLTADLSADGAVSATLTVTKLVVNTEGGTKDVDDFPLFVDGSPVTSGEPVAVIPGAHTVSETADPRYTAAISGDCAADGTIALSAGDVKSCTITNTFVSVHDLAITRITAPRTVRQGSGPRPVNVTIQNRSAHSEVITPADLGDGVTTGLVRLAVSGVDDDGETCGPAGVSLDVERNTALFRAGPKTLRPKATAVIRFLVTYDCPAAARKDARDATPADYQHQATVFHDTLGAADAHPADDACPRAALGPVPNPDGKVVDKGCPAAVTDVVR